MSRRVIGYTGEGRARTPVYAPEPPCVARMTGYVEYAAQGGFATIGGALVEGGPGPVELGRQHQRAHMARRRAAARA